jgi:hypothetical protein
MRIILYISGVGAFAFGTKAHARAAARDGKTDSDAECVWLTKLRGVNF